MYELAHVAIILSPSSAHLVHMLNAQWAFLDRFMVGNTTEDGDTNDNESLLVVATLQHVVTHRLANKLHHTRLCASGNNPRTCTQ